MRVSRATDADKGYNLFVIVWAYRSQEVVLCPIKDVAGGNSEKITVCTYYTKNVVRTPMALIL